MTKTHTVEDYEQQRVFFLGTVTEILKTLDAEDKPKMNSLCDSAFHCAPETTYRMWQKLFNTLSSNFHETAPDGKHAEVVNIYNSKYKEFRNNWYSDDNTD